MKEFGMLYIVGGIVLLIFNLWYGGLESEKNGVGNGD